MFFNIKSTHQRPYFVNAMQEGICYMLRSKLDAYRRESGQDIRMLRVVGGATGSDHWMQMLSDVLGIPVEIPADSRHAGAIGTAYCALIGLGKCADFEEANRIIRVEKRFAPRADHRNIYDENYRVFCGLYPALRELYQAMNA